MTNQPFPYPSPEPLERLRVHDNLTINAKRWLIAHEYHRKRQNIIHQSLYQPGIVHGLGIQLVEATENHPRQSLKIQPGIAIDIWGNPIIVKKEEEFSFKLDNHTRGISTIYIIIKHFVPSNDSENSYISDEMEEKFNLYQSYQPPKPQSGEIELCRIKIEADNGIIKIPDNFIFPRNNEININYRLQAQPRIMNSLHVGAIDELHENLICLAESLPALFPNLNVTVHGNLDLQEISDIYDVIYLPFNKINTQNSSAIKDFLDNQRVVLIEDAQPEESKIENSNSQAINCENFIKQHLLSESQELISWESLLEKKHLLTKKPFLFTELPDFDQQKANLKISSCGKLILATGKLSNAWSGMFSPRHDIRVAHELGINILHFVWQQRYLHQLLH
jgi:hypothetical protein